MTFTPEQIEALDALEGEFGPVDPYLHNVNSREHVEGPYGYEHWITRSLSEALRSWGQYKYALTVDWDEKERIEREKREKALAERSGGIRESLVLGFMTALMPKTNRTMEDADIDFGTSEELFELTVIGWKYNITMEYNRETFKLETDIWSEGHKVVDLTDDLTVLNGNTPPRQQVKGLDAVHLFLDGLAVPE